jgi:DNA primase
MGDEMPKYLNSPETPIYSKSRVLYNLHRAKNAIRQSDFAILVEGYMDTIAVATAGVANVVASCGTSLTETQTKMLHRFSRHAVVSFDPDSAGIAATERSLNLLLEQGFDVRVVALPSGQDPDLFIRKQGAEAYRQKVAQAPPYLDYVIARARAAGGPSEGSAAGGAERKLAALNLVLPYIARIPDPILRSEWASRLAHELQIEEPVLRQELRKSATERRTILQPSKEFLPGGVKLAERRLVQILMESEEHRGQLAEELAKRSIHRATETEAILERLIGAVRAGKSLDPTALAETLPEADRRKLFEIVFEPAVAGAPTWPEAMSCLEALERRQAERELGEVQRLIEEASRQKDQPRLRELLERKQQLRKRLTAGGK